jgi:RXT2-like, N-terminal
MPSQQADIAETIAALKRALKPQSGGQKILIYLQTLKEYHLLTFSPHPAPSTQPITAASNRGNKLKQGAKYVHEGALAFMRGPDVYKQVRWTTHSSCV